MTFGKILRFATRSLWRSPGFTTVAVLTLAIGIGANTAIFTFVNALLLRDFPVGNPEELVCVGVDQSWVLGGCVVGLAGAAVLTRLLEAKLFSVAALDPLTFASAAAFLLLCAALANYLPARRTASVEPMTALRHD